MPYAHRKKLIPRHLDRRIKYTEEDKQNVKTLYKGGMSQRAIAREIGMSRKMVSFILFPEKYEIAKEQFKKRRKDGRYKPKKEEWRKAMREHRNYKQSIKNQLIDKY